MKALSCWQPHASLVAVGAKKNETRSWATKYRGQLAIHAARKWNAELRSLCQTEPFCSALLTHAGITPRLWRGFTGSPLPLGCILAICELVDCVPVEQIRDGLSEQELAFGDYSDGRWAWVLRDVQPLASPVLAHGHQGLWSWTVTR